MNITTNQAADILNVSSTTVRSLVKQGKLVNLKPKGDKKKVAGLFDMKAVKQLKKEWQPQRRLNGNHQLITGEWKPANSEQANARMQRESAPQAISRRLKSLEEKIDHLIHIWS